MRRLRTVYEVTSVLRGQVHMTSAKFSGFWTPFPPCPNFSLTYSIEFTQPPLLHLLLAQPPSPLGVDVICTLPLIPFRLHPLPPPPPSSLVRSSFHPPSG